MYRENGEGGHEEEERLCLWVTGRTAPESWRGLPQDGMSFLKGAVDAILTRSHLSHAKASDLSSSALFREGIVLKAKGGFTARIGQVHPTLARQFGVDDAVYCADLPVAGLLRGVGRGHIQAAELPRFPWVRRDLSLVVPAGTTYSALENVVKQSAGKLLRDVNLFDVYTDDAGVTSYALSMTLQDPNKTLEDKAIDKTVQRVKDQLAQSLGVTLR